MAETGTGTGPSPVSGPGTGPSPDPGTGPGPGPGTYLTPKRFSNSSSLCLPLRYIGYPEHQTCCRVV